MRKPEWAILKSILLERSNPNVGKIAILWLKKGDIEMNLINMEL